MLNHTAIVVDILSGLLFRRHVYVYRSIKCNLKAGKGRERDIHQSDEERKRSLCLSQQQVYVDEGDIYAFVASMTEWSRSTNALLGHFTAGAHFAV